MEKGTVAPSTQHKAKAGGVVGIREGDSARSFWPNN